MSTQVQRRKGTTAQHASFTGASAELTVDTTKNTVVVHDGATAGGIPLAKETGSALSVTSLTSSGASVISTTDSTNAALRITQLGTGNALLVEDSANPDTSPLIVDSNGRLVLGATQAYATTLNGNTFTPIVQTHAVSSNTPAVGYLAANWINTVGNSSFTFAKSRGGAVGTHAITASNDVLGVAYFMGSDGTAFIPAASISVAVDGTPGTDDMPGRMVFSTTADGANSPTERMRITSAGNVGVGTTAPAVELEVSSATGSATPVPTEIRISTTTNASDWSTTLPWGRLSFYSADVSNPERIHGTIDMLSEGAGNSRSSMVFNSAAATTGTLTERMRLTADGNLGLGVAPSAWGANIKAFQTGFAGSTALSGRTDAFQSNLSLNAYDTGSNTWVYLQSTLATRYSQASGTHQWHIAPNGTAGTAITFTQAMTLDASGNLLVGTTSGSNTPTQGVTLMMNTNIGSIGIGHANGTASGNGYANFAYNGAAIGSITQNGTTGVLYNIMSDYRLKNITGPITNSGAYIDSLKPVEGTWKADGSTFVGLIAHETQEVSRTTVATGTKDGAEMQGMDYSSAEIIANLIAELQSLRARVAQLESK